MVGWTGTAFSWLCLLYTASCFSLEGVDDSILFKIRWKEPLGSIEDIRKGEDFETVKMMSADKEPFVCYVPRKLQVEGDDTDVRNYQGPTPYELLEPLFANKVCRYKLDSYWTYQLCHGRSLRQYHEDTIASKVAIMEFYLGKSDAETRKREHEIYKRELEEKLKALDKPFPKPADADSGRTTPENSYSGSNGSSEPTPLTPIIKLDGVDYPSFIMNMSYGTLCDINGKPRFTQVHYICDELSDHDISLFEETSTCMYRVVVRTSLLCKHPMYRVGTTPENEISCHRAEKGSSRPIGDEASTEETPLQSDDDEADENQPRRLQEMERENRDFRKSSMVDSDGSHYDSDFKNLVEAIERNLKIFFLQDEDDERGEHPSHDVKNILGILSGQTCLTGGSGWWRYEFCYGRRVTQYHLEKGERAQEILLGKWDEAKHRQWVNASPFRKVPPDPLYVKHFYSDGDTCSVTGLPRTVVVKLACKAVPGHPDAVSISLQEPKPCEYKLTVESTIICDLLTNVDEHGLPEQLSPANGHKPKAPTTEAQQVKGERKEDAPPTPAA